MSRLAFIPARSGSKGLPDKNILPLCGKPLLAYTVEAALESGLFDTVHVSTDSERYADIARAYGADVPFLRSHENSGDFAGTWDAVREGLARYAEAGGSRFDVVAVLQPTSPLRTAADISCALSLYERRGAESVTSVCEVDHSPLWCNTLPSDGCMDGFIRLDGVGRRQDLGTFYRVNGAIYVADAGLVCSGGDIYGPRSFAYVMPRDRSVDIDSELDFLFAELLMKAALRPSW